MHTHHHHHYQCEIDGLQLFFLTVCAFELGFFMFYMFMYEMAPQSTISDTLFSTPEYAIILTLSLCLRMLGGVMFLFRYRNVFPMWEYAGFVGIFIALFGWGWLVYHKDNPNHFAGVALFCFGSFLYSIAFLNLAGKTHEHMRRLHQALRWFLLMSTLALVIAFVVLWIIEENAGQHKSQTGTRNAYIVEHVAYITQILFYVTFILFHSPNPDKPVEVFRTGDRELLPTYDQDDAAVPLVHLVRVTNLNNIS